MTGRSGASSTTMPDLIPVRMLNEFVYCSRLAYLEWVEQEWADNYETTEGSYKHRRVDSDRGTLPDPDGVTEPFEVSSVHVAAPRLGLKTIIDLVEGEDGTVSPIDYKRGSSPDIPNRAYEPERVQVCAQALILRENGYPCETGYIYFKESDERVPVEISPELVDQTSEHINDLRRELAEDTPPPPLVDSPKCPRCSLVTICMPDEVNLIKGEGEDPRQLLTERSDKIPLYVREYGGSIRKSGKRIIVKDDEDETLNEVPLEKLSSISIYGDCYLTTAASRACLDRDIQICYFSYGGWFYGLTSSLPSKNINLRIKQHDWARDDDACLELSRSFVMGKIKNSRTLLRRNADSISDEPLDRLSDLYDRAEEADDNEELLGYEGAAANVYYSNFERMLIPEMTFRFERRDRRPPADPVNAVMSYLYGVLVKECVVTLMKVGFDPYLGFFHRPKYGRPALALDLMEEFRSIIADSVLLTLFNNRQLTEENFQERGDRVNLRSSAKKTLLNAYENRLNQEVTHPLFDYAASYRRVLEMQARLIARRLDGDIDHYPPFCTR